MKPCKCGNPEVVPRCAAKHDYVCRACLNERKRRAWRNQPDGTKERVLARMRARSKALPKRAGEYSSARYTDRSRATLAHQKLERAVRRGLINKPDQCEQCRVTPEPRRDGRSALQGHHADYSKPLDVRWLCARCHRNHHALGKAVA